MSITAPRRCVARNVTRLTLLAVGLCGWIDVGFAQSKEALEKLSRAQTGIDKPFNDFSKDSDDELVNMLDTLKKNRNDLSPEAFKGNTSWFRYEQDLKAELDRRGRTADGGWKKPYEDAQARKKDINKEIEQKARQKQDTNPDGVERRPARPNDTQAFDGKPGGSGTRPEGLKPPDATGAVAPANPPGGLDASARSGSVPDAPGAGRASGPPVDPVDPNSRSNAGDADVPGGSKVDPGDADGFLAKAGKALKGVLGGLAVWGAGEAVAEGSARTIDHKEKLDTIQTALNTIEGRREALEAHLKAVGDAHNLADAADEKGHFTSAEALAAIDEIKGVVGPEKAADLEQTVNELKQLDEHQAAIEKGREDLTDKWRTGGVGDMISSAIPFTASTALDDKELNQIPELKLYVPELDGKEPGTEPGTASEPPSSADPSKRDPAVEQLLAALTPEQRRQVDQLNDQQILALLEEGEGDAALTPPEPILVEATMEEAPEDDPPPPLPPPGGEDEEEEAGEGGFYVTDGPTYPDRGSTEDFTDEEGGDLDTEAPGGAQRSRSSGGTGIDTTRFRNGQQAAEAERRRQVEGAYEVATELDAELRASEHEAKEEANKLQQLMAEREAAQDKADAQRQRRIEDQKRRTNQALKRYLAKKQQRDRMRAMRRAARSRPAPHYNPPRSVKPSHPPIQRPPRQAPPARQPAPHQSGGIIADPPQ